MTAAKVIWV